VDEGAYPPLDGKLEVLALRNERGRAIAPQWTTYELGKHPHCENHQAHRPVVVAAPD
jgi:hypothetical protein